MESPVMRLTPMNAQSCPILFLVFNRPDLTSRTFASIRSLAPERLFIAADGPRQDRGPVMLLLQRRSEKLLRM